MTVTLKIGVWPQEELVLGDASCASVSLAINGLLASKGAGMYSVYGCSSDLVELGTSFRLSLGGGAPFEWTEVISLVSSSPPQPEHAASGAFDVATGSEFFGFGFGVVVFFYLLGLKGSVILRHFWRH